ncbi:MAG: peptidoglycan recognition protein family protein [Rhodobacteraceae bacterium]|nr:peptidoglycan recognition protein family protein [Paracoccaceae bacterium]
MNDSHASILAWQTRDPRNPRRWPHIRYHYVIEKTGRIVQGPPESVVSGGTRAHSRDSLEVCLCGHFDEQMPAPAAIERLTALLANWCKTYGLDPGPTTIVGHNEIQPMKGDAVNKCPGANLRAMLPRLRAAVRLKLASMP